MVTLSGALLILLYAAVSTWLLLLLCWLLGQLHCSLIVSENFGLQLWRSNIQGSFIADLVIHFLPYCILFDWKIFKDSKIEDSKS